MTHQEIKELAGHREVPPWVIKLVGDAVQREREACAELCEKLDSEDESYYSEFSRAPDCANAIRARGQQ